MSDENTSSTTEQNEAPASTPAPTEPPAQVETDWKAEARKWEARAKENRSSLDSLTSERDDLLGKVTGLTEQVTEFKAAQERSDLLAEVAKAKGVPADALRGNTREEIEAHADVLATLIKPSAPVIPGQGKAPQNIPPSPEREAVRSLFGRD